MSNTFKLSFLIFLCILIGCSPYYSSIKKEKFLCMGTQIEVIFVVPENLNIDSEYFLKEIKEKCYRYENKFSIFKSESIINKINSSKECYIDKETEELLNKAIYLSDLTNGAFDFTITPLLRIWGFYEDKVSEFIPTKSAIQSVMQYVNYKKINLDSDKNLVIKEDKKIKIDLSGLAKGFIVDKIIQMIKKKGIKQALVNAGGDMYCLGKAPDKKDWKIGIQHPRMKHGIIGKLNLSDMAIVTSGDYENCFYLDKKRYSHIINPITGYPVSNNLVSVTVIAEDTAIADGLGTAIMVLGEKKGLKLINNLEQVEGIIAKQNKKEIVFFLSNGLKNKSLTL